MKDFSEQIQQIVNKITQKGSNLEPILVKIAALVNKAILKNFAEGGRWDGKGTDLFSGGSYKWKPLAKSTIKNYRKKGFDLEPTLNRRGDLRRSISVVVSGRNSILISANSEYAAIHNYGGTIEIQGGESEAKWKVKKNKAGNYTYKFAKKQDNAKNVISRKFKRKSRQLIMPARPFLTLTENDIEEIIKKLTTYLV